MPLYEYQCESCGRTMEVMQAFSDPPPAGCERCGSPVRKLLSSPAFQFKGTGWYVSDYGRASSGAKSGEGAGEGKSSEQRSGEAKPSEPKPSEGTSGESKAGEVKAPSSGAAPSAGAKSD